MSSIVSAKDGDDNNTIINDAADNNNNNNNNNMGGLQFFFERTKKNFRFLCLYFVTFFLCVKEGRRCS